MARICGNCGFHLQENHFLCPQCGTIYEEPAVTKALEVCEHKGAPASSKSANSYVKRWIMPICAVVLLVVFIIWLDLVGKPANPEQNSSTHSTQPAGSTATPEVIPYTVTFIDEEGNPVPNVQVQFGFEGTFIIAAGLTDENGCFTTIFKSNRECWINVVSVPDKYAQTNRTSFYFTDGATMTVVLKTKEELPPHGFFEYSVTVIDENGDPVPDVAIRIGHNHLVYEAEGLTGSDGLFAANYKAAEGCYAQVQFIPNGYSLSAIKTYYFDEYGSRDMIIVLSAEDDTSKEDIYSVTVIDNLGNPVPYVQVRIGYGDSGRESQGLTNMDGRYWVEISGEGDCFAVIDNVPEGYANQKVGVTYRFAEGFRYMQIIIALDLPMMPFL